MEDIYKIAGLIRKFRTHTLSANEARELWEWVNTDNHRQLFERLLDRKQEARVLYELQRYELQPAYERFRVRIHTTHRRIGFYLRVAAMLLLPLTATTFIYWWRNFHQQKTTLLVQSPVIPPGSRQAILTLTDGRQLPLGKHESPRIIADAESRLKYDSAGLSYELKKSASLIRKNRIDVPRKGEFSLTLSDGTRVYLNSDTRMTYPLVFEKNKREVELEGEAYFEVVRDSTRPFFVRTKDLTIRVLGTAFDVKCYADEDYTATTLVQGSVNVVQSGKELHLQPGEQSRYHRQTNVLDKTRVNTLLYTSWKDGLFIFERQRLEDLFIVLSRWYDVQVFFERQELKDKLFTGDLKRYTDISVCLRMLELTNDVEFEIRGTTILVK